MSKSSFEDILALAQTFKVDEKVQEAELSKAKKMVDAVASAVQDDTENPQDDPAGSCKEWTPTLVCDRLLCGDFGLLTTITEPAPPRDFIRAGLWGLPPTEQGPRREDARGERVVKAVARRGCDEAAARTIQSCKHEVVGPLKTIRIARSA